jgi:hypothetical protein
MTYTSADGMAALDAKQPVLPAIDTSWNQASTSKGASDINREVLSPAAPQSSSKTAAFFGSSSHVVRPTSLSVSSGSSSHASPPYALREVDDADVANTSSSTLSRFGSWRGSQRGNRQWDNFEGKPVTPLPSPGGAGSRAYPQGTESTNVFDSEYERGIRGIRSNSSSRNSSRERQTADISISDSFSSLPSFASMGSMHPVAPSGENQPTSMTASSSKTKNFFGTSRPILPASKTSYNGQSSSGSSSTSSPPQPVVSRRLPSNTSLFYEPSRLPSAPFEAGGSISGINASSSATATPTARTPTLNSDHSSSLEPAYNVNPPLATVSPPSPQPDSDHQSDSAPSSGFLSSFPSSPPTQRYNARHTHGPSDMATGSSFLPTRNGVSKHSQSDRREARREEAYQEESEDESSGRIGRYKIDKTLGVGAFSRVALASEIRSSDSQEPTKSGRLVALKMLEREPCNQNERMRVSWIREVEILKVSVIRSGQNEHLIDLCFISNSTLFTQTSFASFLPFQHQSITI